MSASSETQVKQMSGRPVFRMMVLWSVGLVLGVAGMTAAVRGSNDGTFDHEYRAYSKILSAHLVGARVEYAKLADNRAELERVVQAFGNVQPSEFRAWSREQQLAYWINAYNLFTLKVIVDHYPIQGSWFSLHPRNSIRQIDGVWDELTWKAAGRAVTLDEIEHEILRPTFDEPLIHFAINCAALSCPPLRPEAYLADTLDAQLADSTRRALSLDGWLQIDGVTLRVTAILDWFGEDFIPRHADRIDVDLSPRDRAILGLIAEHGPPAAQSLAADPNVRVRFLRYDWSLNDVSGS